MNWVACNFGKNLELEKSQEFNDTFSYMKVYFGKLNWECVTMERSLDGTTIFSKYVNNTEETSTNDRSEVSLKAETFFHYTYVNLSKKTNGFGCSRKRLLSLQSWNRQCWLEGCKWWHLSPLFWKLVFL